MMKKSEVQSFLTELTALTQKYNIRIEGCGCCSSPVLLPVGVNWEYSNILARYLELKEDGTYSVDWDHVEEDKD